MREDRPFDQDKERRDPWRPDESYRLISRDSTEQDVHLYHLHINTDFGEQDLDCVMPLRRLKELEEAGKIGRSAPTHYSFQGFVLKPRELLEESVPAMIHQMKAERGRCSGAGACLTVLLPVGRAGAEGDRGSGHLDHLAFHDP
jgi:hypothetical protein